MRGDRKLAAATEARAKTRALRDTQDASHDGPIVRVACNREFVITPRLDRDRALPNCRQHLTDAIRALIRSCKPSRIKPADASITASYCPSSSFRIRVSTFPRRSFTTTSPRKALSCASRRWLDVPTTAPAGKSRSEC